MELIRTIKDKQVTRHENDLIKQAEDKIQLSDFSSNLFIAFNGVPLVPIGEDWLPQDIINELSKLRRNYVQSKMKDYNPTLLQSIFKTSC